MIKTSIIVPTCYNYKGNLRPCLVSLLKYTTFEDKELIIVRNGLEDFDKEDYENLIGEHTDNPENIIMIEEDEPIGYPKAINLGIKQSRGELLVLLNDDTEQTQQEKNTWINMLWHPFGLHEKVGLSGPLKHFKPEIKDHYLVFFCTAIHRKVIDDIGLLDEDYGIGGNEDIEYCIRAKQAGYIAVQVPDFHVTGVRDGKMVGNFPMTHEGEQTMHTMIGVEKWNEHRKKIEDKLLNLPEYQEYYKHRVLNIGCGDDYDPMAVNIDANAITCDMQMDARQLFFRENEFDGIRAVHLLEHISVHQVNDTIKGWLRVVKPDGKIYIEMPDVGALAEEYVKSDRNGKRWVLEQLYCAHAIGDEHKFGWTYETFSDHLKDLPCKIEQVEPRYHTEKNERVFAVEITKPGREDVLCVVPTRNRYDSTLTLTLNAIAMQTKKPDKIIVYDDSDGKIDMRTHPTLGKAIQQIEDNNILWEVLFNQERGQVWAHRHSLETSYKYIWRVDDDLVPKPDVLELLHSTIKERGGAVASAVRNLGSPIINKPDGIANTIDTPYINEQWFKSSGITRAEHLYSTFLYEREKALKAGGYEKRLSSVGHREETILTHRMHRAGYPLWINHDAVCYHYRMPHGGIRDEKNKEKFEADETIFNEIYEGWGYKNYETHVLTLTHGLGDNFAFKKVLKEMLVKYPNRRYVVGVSFPNAFYDIADDRLKIVPTYIAEMAGAIKDEHSVYAWCIRNNWKGTLQDAYRRMYL